MLLEWMLEDVNLTRDEDEECWVEQQSDNIP